MDRFGIYVHIPFCKKKCKYCDFISFFCNKEKQEEYFEKLNKEIENKKTEKLVTTIYFGGGTPSFPDAKHIIKILNSIKQNFNVSGNAEITLEVNPGTVNYEKLIAYKNAGINRISLGLQTTQNGLLELIGRVHTFEEFLDTYELVKKAGFTNINIDLMLALPTQEMEELIDSLNEVIKLDPKHISIYSLIVEAGTEIENMINTGKIQLPDEEIERKMYWKTKNILEQNGYNHYEISNFAKKGFESKHNLDCWNQEDYLGLGLSAHSYIGGKRFSNTSNLEQYLECENFEDIVEIHEIQNREAKAKEFMLIGFRKIEGISISEFERKFRVNPLFYFRFEIHKLTKYGLIEVDLDNIRLTKKGLDLANIVFEEFI